MECKKCGFNNIEGAKFCSECGYRLDGKKVCPGCNQTVNEEAKFCPYCGIDLKGKITKEIVVNQKKTVTDKKTNFIKIFDFIKIGSLSFGVLFSLIFFLMTGLILNASSSGVGANIFDMLGDLFKFSIGPSQRVDMNVYIYESELLLHILTLVIICLFMLSVPLFSGIFIYKVYEKYYLKKENSVETFGVLTCLSYLGGVYLLLNLNYMMVMDQVGVQLNGPTKAGIILVLIFIGIYAISHIVEYCLSNGIKKKTLISKIINFILLILNVVMLMLSSGVGLSLISKTSSPSINVDTAFGLFPALYVGTIQGFTNKVPLTFYDFGNAAVLISFFNSVINVLFIISLTISIVGLFKNLKSSKFNGFNICSLSSIVLSVVVLILAFISKYNYESGLEKIGINQSVLVVGTHLVITMVVLTIVTAIIMILQKKFLAEEK